MGLFGFGKNKETNNIEPTISTESTVSTEPTREVKQPTNGILNLKKNDVLDLTKADPTLNQIRVAAGWDVSKHGNGDYDLDLCAIMVDKNNKIVKNCNSLIYYGEKTSTGIYLDQDNLTGEGEGDDENIHVKLNKIPDNIERIIFNVVIYSASARGQSFKHVENAFVRLVDEEKGEKEICRYNLSENGGNNTAVEFVELYRNNNGWAFKTIGNYLKATIKDLKRKYK